MMAVTDPELTKRVALRHSLALLPICWSAVYLGGFYSVSHCAASHRNPPSPSLSYSLLHHSATPHRIALPLYHTAQYRTFTCGPRSVCLPWPSSCRSIHAHRLVASSKLTPESLGVPFACWAPIPLRIDLTSWPFLLDSTLVNSYFAYRCVTRWCTDLCHDVSFHCDKSRPLAVAMVRFLQPRAFTHTLVYVVFMCVCPCSMDACLHTRMDAPHGSPACACLAPSALCYRRPTWGTTRSAWRFYKDGGDQDARRLFFASLWHLPLILLLLVVHKKRSEASSGMPPFLASALGLLGIDVGAANVEQPTFTLAELSRRVCVCVCACVCAARLFGAVGRASVLPAITPSFPLILQPCTVCLPCPVCAQV